jgi:hypothetical membrane protein
MLHSTRQFWQSSVFTFVIISTTVFVVMTVVAMFFYPGGTWVDPNTHGYSLTENFFSDLGRWTTRSGASSPVSATLFLFALTLAGCGLTLFFIAFPQFFQKSRSQLVLSISGSVFGVLSGLCFVGVACFPADRFLPVHRQFVMFAFRLLLQFGPSPFKSHQGEVIQAVGQKIIVYASILSITFQAWGAKRANHE